MKRPPFDEDGVPPWELPDDKLLERCRFEAFVGSGPGGQRRHKTNAAVRYTHLTTRISAMATDSRSQRENRIHALRELRHKLALTIRRDIDPQAFRPPEWFAEYPGLRINAKNPRYPAALAIVLDVLRGMHSELRESAVLFGVTTSALAKFLADDPAAWTHVNESRVRLGMKALRRRS